MSFGVQWQSFYGTSGQFKISTPTRGDVTACYIQTRIRAAKDGQWDSLLTEQMKPWREVFPVNEMSFDELLQRDLDDARVANELIPYLMGTETSRYPVFPPILAVLAPNKKGGDTRAGIEKFYPKPSGTSFGDVFAVEPFKINGEDSPVSEVKYNSQRCRFVIVDGQHRAMALIALFRQLGGAKDWNSDPHATYYSHIKAKEEEISHIQLPVCVLYFPGIFEESEEYKRNEINLLTVCRQIFLDVNKQARRVSVARERLLDDSNFPPMLMRSVLSRLRNVTDGEEISRIYSFDYGRDDSSDLDRNIVTAPTEYSSSHILFVAMGALCFGNVDAFDLASTTDITNGINRRNSDRPVRLLSEKTIKRNISVHHAADLPKEETQRIVNELGSLWEPLLPGMFHTLRPYKIHNKALSQLHGELSSPANRANAALNEAREMIFDSGGSRSVFDQHLKKLDEIKKGNLFNTYRSEDIVNKNITHCKTVLQACQTQEARFQKQRAYAFWQINPDSFAEGDDNNKKVIQSSAEIYRAFSNQALQLGYVMAVSTLAHYMLKDLPLVTYEENRKVILFASTLFLETVNEFFSPGDIISRKTLDHGLISKSRINIFNPKEIGLRTLFNANKPAELNERAWPFFRYAFFEILFAPSTTSSHGSVLKNTGNDMQKLYLEVMPDVITSLIDRRNDLQVRFVNAWLEDAEFKREINAKYHKLIGAGKTEEEANKEKLQWIEEEKKKRTESAKEMFKASIEQEKNKATIEAQVNKLIL